MDDAWTRFISSEAPLKAPKERWYRYLPHSPSLPSDILLQSIWLIDARKISLWHDRTDAASKKRDLSQIPDSTHFAFRVASLFLLPRIMQMEKEEKEETEERERARKELSEREKESVASHSMRQECT